VIGILIGAGVAFVFAMAATPYLIRVLKARGIGQPIHDALAHHAAKSGTPTMGGMVIPAGLVTAYLATELAGKIRLSERGLTIVGVVVGGGLVGALDDWLKVRRGRNLGLREAQKTSMQLVVIVGFCVAYLLGPRPCTGLSVTSCHSIAWDPGPVGWAIFALALLWATSNGVNFTDGMEGLLSGSATASFTVLAIIGFWEFRHPTQYGLADPLELSVIAAALAASCAGFLWWNVRPMTIFMGDTGSLAIGMGIAGLALALNVALLVPVFGALYVIEGGSSALQRYTYKLYFKPRGGQRRLFRMAPLHFHFELGGWPESTVIVRFWLVSGLAAAGALAIFYGSSLSHH